MHVDRGWIVVARSLGGENGKLAFNECRLSGRGDEKVLKLDSGVGCAT